MNNKQNTDEENPDTVEVEVLYTGRTYPGGRHEYIRLDTKVELYFKKKLQRGHEIGGIYKAEAFNDGRTWRMEPDSLRYHEDNEQVILWERRDEMTSKEAKRQAERAKLTKLAREAAKTFRDEYRRAHTADQQAMLRALVRALHED